MPLKLQVSHVKEYERRLWAYHVLGVFSEKRHGLPLDIRGHSLLGELHDCASASEKEWNAMDKTVARKLDES